MNCNSFNEVYNDWGILYFIEGKYRESLNVLEKAEETLPQKVHEKFKYNITLYKSMINVQLKEYNECLGKLTDLVENGFVCPLYHSTFSDVFGENDAYIELREKNNLLRQQQQEKSKLKCEVILPKSYSKKKKYPLFISLHGDADSIDFHKGYWKAQNILNKGYIFVYLQSSQVVKHNGYTWQKRIYYSPNKEDWAIGEHVCQITETSYFMKDCYDTLPDELRKWYQDMVNNYSIDEDQIVVAGFSGGAVAALEISMAGYIPVKGFITISTHKPKIFNEKNVESMQDRGIKGVFMEGELDLPVEEVDTMINLLKKKNFPYQYYINKGIGHWYPKDLDRKIEQALQFILEV